MPIPIPGTVVGASAQVGPGGDTGSTAATPLADSTQNGFLRKVSGNTTDFIDGTNNSQPLAPATQPTIWSARLRSFNAAGNPNFEVDQKLCGSAHAFIGFSMDRWIMYAVGTMAGNAQQINANVVLPGTNFFITSKILRITLTTAEPTLGAGDYLYFYQPVEGPQLRELLGDVHSMSLLVRSTVANLKFGMCLQDTGSTTHSLTKLCTLGAANTWTLIPLANLPIWTPSGTFSPAPGGVGYYIEITLAAGSTFTAPANDIWQTGNVFGALGQSNFAASPVNSTFDIAFVQHEPGAQCTTPIDKPFAANYDECLRYFSKNYNYTEPPGTLSGATGVMLVQYGPAAATVFRNFLSFPKAMAKIPTVQIYNHGTGALNSIRDFGGVDLAMNNANNSGVAVSEKGISAIVTVTASAYGGVYPLFTADTGW